MERMTEDGKVVCVFAGRMDTVRCQEIDEDVLVALSDENVSNGVIFDLSEVDYVCSAFLRYMIMAAKKGALAVRGPQPPVRKLLKIAGLDSVASIE